MNLVVCLKAVPAQAENPSIVDAGLNVRFESKSFVLNESDEHALEQALILKKKIAATVTLLTLGSVRSNEVLFRGLAKGADAAVRVDGDEFDPNITALKLATALKKIPHDLILTGVESLDAMASQVVLLVAARLGVPCAYAVTSIDVVSEHLIRIVHELGGGTEQTLEIKTPALLSIQAGNDVLTYPVPAKLVQVRRKPIPCWSLVDLELTDEQVDSERKLRVVAVESIEPGRNIEWIEGTPVAIADKLFSKIREVLDGM